MNSEKIILDLCGGTGAWSQPYKDAGYNVLVITLPEFDLMDTQMIGDQVVSFSRRSGWLHVPYAAIYGILFAPTCTQFSLARTTAKTPRNLLKGYELVRMGKDIINNSRQHGSLKFWAMENPMGYLRQMEGLPPLTFDPCDYGDAYTKKTDLWGYYKMPKKTPVKLTAEAKARCAINNRELPEIPEGYILPKDINPQAVRRSITSSHFAKAFYKANKV